jgi:hypothetical protein
LQAATAKTAAPVSAARNVLARAADTIFLDETVDVARTGPAQWEK